MTTDAHWTERLSEYLDGELGERDRKALEAHVAACTECATVLEDLRAVVAEAQALPDPEVSEALNAELWAGIEPRLKPRRRWFEGLLEALVPAPAGRRFSFSVPQLAGAALAVAVVSAGAAMWISGRGASPTPAPGGPVAVAPPAGGQAPATAVPAGFDAPLYSAAVEDLEKTFAAHRSELDPETVKVVEANLAIIDEAVEQARRALLADPANPYLNGHLATQMRWKLRVLQQATMTLATANG